jgi:hypothetical protein
MKPYAQEAENLRLLLKADIVSIGEVVAWADQKILTLPEYDDDLAEISLGAEVSMAEMDLRLRRASAGADTILAVRRLLGRMHQVLLSNELRAGEFARVLDSLWREIPYDPDDFGFMTWIYDCFLDPESVRGEPIDIFIEEVAPFDTTWPGLTQAKSGKILGRLRRFFRRGQK